MIGYGWAASKNGKLLVNTVSKTRKAAQINWLVGHAGRMVHQNEDADIEKIWVEHRPDDVDLVEVRIEPRNRA